MAEEAKFTPGPWHIVRYGDGDSLVIHYTDEQRICFLATPGGSRRQWEIIQANAHLIAEAPSLYDALKVAVEHIEQWVEPEGMGVIRSGDGVLGHYRRDELLINLRAALSRAQQEEEKG